MTLTRRLATAVALLALVIGVGSGFAVSAGIAPGPLTGDWLLVKARGVVAPFAVENAGISLTMTGGTATGYAACDDYRLRVSGEPAELDFRPAASPDPPVREVCPAELLKIRQLYLAALGSTSRAAVEGRTLRLFGSHAELTFTAAPPFPTGRLAGSSWVLESFGETWSGRSDSPLVGTSVLQFFGDDRFSASLACRTLVGFYRVVGTQTAVVSQRLGPSLAASTGYCPRPAVLQDLFVSDVLQGFRASVDGDRLILTRNRLEVVFRAATADEARR